MRLSQQIINKISQLINKLITTKYIYLDTQYISQMHFQPTELFHQWVTQEIQHFKTSGKISVSDEEQEIRADDQTFLIGTGFIDRLFQQIDPEYFAQEVQKFLDTGIKRESLLKEYWFSLNKYLQARHNKKISQNYLSLQTVQKKQLTSRDYSRKSNSSTTSSVIELVKLQFYLLVQKYKKGSNDYDDLNDQMNEKNHQMMEETLSSSNLIQEGNNTEDDGKDQLINTTGSVQSIESINNGSQSLLIESKGQIETELEVDGEFLQRICQLPEQVQEYLVSIVESIQQQEILQPYQFFPTQSTLIESIIYPATENTSQNTSSPNQNFKRHIFKQIEQVNQQNQELKEKIQQILQENAKLQKQLQDNQQQQTILITKINNYNQEKEELFDYLKYQNNITITSLQQFIQIVHHIQQENQLLQNTIAQIQQRNYQLETENAQKIHSINKNALQITKINQDITKFKTKIKGLKEDIQYLDEFVNGNNPLISAQMINSINVGEFDQNQEDQIDCQEQNQGSFFFNKSIDLQARTSFGNVLRENHDIYNQKVTNKSSQRHSHNRVLTDSLTGYGPNRISLNQKLSTHKKNNKSSIPPFDQQNIDPTPFEQDELKMQHFAHFPSKSHSHISVNYELKEEERQIEQEKEKYKQDLVNSLEQLYKEINDLTKDVTQAKQENKALQKKNKINQKKITQLKYLHEAFLKEANKA